MLRASDYDRFYRLLGVEPGGSLTAIEAQWKLCCAAVHPDKFEASGKPLATRRIQEINNARDELRRYWRRHGGPPPTSAGNGPRIRTVRLPDDPAAETAQPSDDSPTAEAAGVKQRSAAPGRAVLPKRRRRGPAFVAAAAVATAIALVVAGLMQEDSGAPSTAGAVSTERISAQTAPSPQAPRPVAAVMPPQPAAAELVPQRAPRLVPPPSTPVAALTGVPPDAAPIPPLKADAAPPLPNPPPIERTPEIDQTPIAPIPAPKPPRMATVQSAGDPSSLRPATTPMHTRPQPTTAASRQEALRQAAIDACRNDLRTLCAGVQAGEGRIAQCAREHFQQLSSGCSGALMALRGAHPGTAANSER